MPAPMIISNVGEISRLEGMYIQEVTPPVVLKGVFLGVVAVAGTAVRGPSDLAIPITSAQRFYDVFGSRNISGSSGNPDSNLWTFLQKKAFGKLQMVRVQAAAAIGSQLAVLSGTGTSAIGLFFATSSGSFGNQMTAQVISASDNNALHRDFNVVREGKNFRYKNLDFSSWTNAQSSLTASQLVQGSFLNEPSLPVYFQPVAGAFGVPGVLAATSLVSGTDGSVADADYTTAGRGINVATNVKEASVVLAAEYESAAVKSTITTLAGTAEANGKVFLIGPNDGTVSLASAVTDVASYRDDNLKGGRIVYCFNHANMIDPTTVNAAGASTLSTFPKSWMASILSQIDVDIDPGESDTYGFLAGIFSLNNENYVREDYITLRNAGICALEKTASGQFGFVSAVTTNLTSGLERITRRRMVDFLEGTIAQLSGFAKKKNTLTNRKKVSGAITTFLKDLKSAERVVGDYRLDPDVLNTDAGRAQGVEGILVKVRLVSHMLSLWVQLDASTNTSTT